MCGGRVAPFVALAFVLVAASFFVLVPGSARAGGLSPHAPIVIASNADFTAANGVTGGSGTWNDPYVISGWDIDASSSVGLLVENTNAAFVLRDISVHSGGPTYNGVTFQTVANAVVSNLNASFDYEGLSLTGVSNVSVVGGTFSFNAAFGISAATVSGLRIAGATVVGNQVAGITVLQASQVQVSGNLVRGDPSGPFSQEGIGFSDVTGGTINNNFVTEFNNDGIGVFHSLRVNVSQNRLSDSQWAFEFGYNVDSFAWNNTFLSNVYGILAYSDSRANLTENYFQDNRIALYLESMDLTYVVDNAFVLNGRGIWQVDSTSSTIAGNVMTGDGLTILGTSQAAFDTHTITPDNTVNGLPILYFKDTANVVVDGARVGEVLVAGASGVELTNLAIADTDSPIEVAYSSGVQITSCVLQNDWNSILLEQVTGAVVVGNELSGVTYGLLLEDSQHLDVRANAIFAARYGVYLGTSNDASVLGNNIVGAGIAGIALESSTSALVAWNNVTLAHDGITVDISGGVTLWANNIVESQATGIALTGSSGVSVVHNTFNANAVQASADAGTTATWDAGYPAGGNFWSDYAGIDVCSGPAQNVCAGGDGIGDTPRVIDAANVDHYPLMSSVVALGPVASFVVTPTLGVPGTSFSVDASTSYDTEAPTPGLLYRWDWTGDGVYDTPWSASPTATHTFAADGRYAIGLEVLGVTGLVGGTTQLVLVDSTPPVTTALLSGLAGTNGWFRSEVTVTLSAFDAVSGVASTSYRIDGGAWTAYAGPFTVALEGSHVVTFQSVDVAGNVETAKSVTVKIDRVAPTVSLSLTGSQGKSAWFRAPVVVTLTATDATSGVGAILYRLDGGAWQVYVGPFTLVAPGTHTLDVQAFDNAGNGSPILTRTFTVKK